MLNTMFSGWLAWYRMESKRTIMNDSPNEKAPHLGRIGAYQYWIEPTLAEKVGAETRYKSMTFFRNAMIYAMFGDSVNSLLNSVVNRIKALEGRAVCCGCPRLLGR